MSEQLNINFDEDNTSENRTDQDARKVTDIDQFEPLDHQLISLFTKLNAGIGTSEKAAILALSKNTREGQIYLPCNSQLESVLLNSVIAGKADEYKPLIIDNGFLYFNRYYSYQKRLAHQIRLRITPPDQEITDIAWLKQKLNDYFEENEGEPSKTNFQKLATERAIKQSFLILSGGPGTGKTTTISRILSLLIEQHNQIKRNKDKLKIVLAAPTGKASIRMLDSLREAQQHFNLPDDISQQMPVEAFTLHKLLGTRHNKVHFKHIRHSQR